MFSQIDRENARDAGRFDSYYLLMILGLDMSCRRIFSFFCFFWHRQGLNYNWGFLQMNRRNALDAGCFDTFRVN